MMRIYQSSTFRNIASKSHWYHRNPYDKSFSWLIVVAEMLQTLYAGTIRFNIMLGATRPESEVTQEEIEAACRDSNILDFIQSLPKCVKRPLFS
jgi:ABC-type bacteriocin/lantibiotic exporter with double-glycine peptidase domain